MGARPLSPASFHSALDRAFDEVGRKEAAAALGVSEAMISKWCSPDEERGIPSAHLQTLSFVYPGFAAIIAQHFASHSGLAIFDPDEGLDALASLSSIVDQHASLTQAFLGAASAKAAGDPVEMTPELASRLVPILQGYSSNVVALLHRAQKCAESVR